MNPTLTDRLRAARACGKWHDRTAGFDKIALRNVRADLGQKAFLAKTDAAAERLIKLIYNLDEVANPWVYNRKYTTCLEWRKGEWYRWTLSDGEPIEFRRLNPQPPPPNH